MVDVHEARRTARHCNIMKLLPEYHAVVQYVNFEKKVLLWAPAVDSPLVVFRISLSLHGTDDRRKSKFCHKTLI